MRQRSPPVYGSITQPDSVQGDDDGALLLPFEADHPHSFSRRMSLSGMDLQV